jgi:hypothetical protein
METFGIQCALCLNEMIYLIINEKSTSVLSFLYHFLNAFCTIQFQVFADLPGVVLCWESKYKLFAFNEWDGMELVQSGAFVSYRMLKIPLGCMVWFVSAWSFGIYLVLGLCDKNLYTISIHIFYHIHDCFQVCFQLFMSVFCYIFFCVLHHILLNNAYFVLYLVVHHSL